MPIEVKGVEKSKKKEKPMTNDLSYEDFEGSFGAFTDAQGEDEAEGFESELPEYEKEPDENKKPKNLEKLARENINISIFGLGYVGLPLAIKLSSHFKVLGFVIN